MNDSATIDASGSGALVFSNTGAIVLAGYPPITPTLNLIGTSTAANTFMPELADPPNGLLSVFKDRDRALGSSTRRRTSMAA